MISCDTCIYCRTPKIEPSIFSPDGGWSTGKIKAADAELGIEKEWKRVEMDRIKKNYEFIYEPKLNKWCSKFTLTDKQLDTIKDDETEKEVAIKKGYKFKFNPVTGEYNRVYAICFYINKGECKYYESIKKNRKEII